MSNSNQRTIESYEAHIQEYVDGTPHDVAGYVKELLDEALSDLPKTARILEIGSAFGRDAAYVQELGYTVECTDATLAFVDLLKQTGFDARQLNAITDELEGPYDLVIANAVLLHFTRDETKQVLRKIFDALSSSGRFAFTLKQGKGEQWSENKLGAPRYFCYWTAEQILEVVEGTGFTKVEISEDEGARDIWLQIVAHK